MKKRDYKAEYARRIARASARGIPRHVARGHAPKNVIGIRLAKVLGVAPGTKFQDRPTFDYEKTPSKEAFEELLERNGFTDFLVEARKDWLRREEVVKQRQLKETATSQEAFITAVLKAGFDEREAYTQWFSPK